MTLDNPKLHVTISTAGAELASIFSKEKNQEFLWQGSLEWWPRRAPVLFPIVGKLNQNSFRYQDKSFSLPQHGFARDSEFTVEAQSESVITFLLSSTEPLRTKFPFDFQLRIRYTLIDSTLEIRYEIKNPADTSMYFSIGAHPGFALAPGESLSDYYIEFEKTETLDRHLLEEGLFNGKTERVVTASRKMDLNDEMMRKDAVVFKDMKSTILWLKSRRSDYVLKFHSPGFPYFGIWSKPGASFVCLEPWCGLADKKGYSGELTEKEGIRSLGSNEVFISQFSVTV
ncbi:aldose 1-epimerase family protein [soil metagenome]